MGCDGQAADPLTGAVGFARVLRAAGVPVGTDATGRYLRALGAVDLAERRQVYWAGRATLCWGPEDIPLYDLAFQSWFSGAPPPVAARGGRIRETRIAGLSTGPRGGAGREDDADGEDLRVAAGDAEVLRHRDIAELTPAERAHLDRMLAGLRATPPTRPALRRRPARTGPVDPRRTLRRTVTAGGEPVRPLRHRRARRPRRVVLLIDVSGSMRPYADALLRFAHAVSHGAAGGARTDVEVFSLGTRLTRLTRAMGSRDPETALAAAGRAVPDWAGGTRLGETLGVFLGRHGRRGMARGATVVVFSDGWERGDASLLGEQVALLRRLAHAVIWVNPHAGAAGFQPVQSGMAAALPHVDRLLAGHTLATLQRLLMEVRDA
ncbi:vWA domain-containing protein [Tomitella cavernea]|uniref:vWA domain-containing protein n=1 Tax=Tomitella cavernea TaxID=1387982 RepID=UPI001908F669|nr:VWA domain-containing protein [Tomitella cavernea]